MVKWEVSIGWLHFATQALLLWEISTLNGVVKSKNDRIKWWIMLNRTVKKEL